jgi:hypothetical protein
VPVGAHGRGVDHPNPLLGHAAPGEGGERGLEHATAASYLALVQLAASRLWPRFVHTA